MADWNGEIASREELRERKRRAALRVASRLFNEKGYHATSLDEIADRIGVTKTALYYYFRNKEELLYECIEISLKAGERAKAETEEAGPGAFDRFRTFYLAFLRHVIEDGGTYATLVNIRALPASMQQQLVQRRETLRAHIQSLLDRAVAEGRLREVETESTSLFLFAAINWIMAYSLEQHGGRADPKITAEAFLDQVLRGLESR